MPQSLQNNFNTSALVSVYHFDVARTVRASCAATIATKKHSNSCFTRLIALYKSTDSNSSSFSFMHRARGLSYTLGG